MTDPTNQTLTPITYDQVQRELQEIISRYPDGHTYRPASLVAGCKYVHTNPRTPLNYTPGCLIGQWLHFYRGVSLYDLHTRYDRPPGGYAHTGVKSLYIALPDHPIRTAAPVTRKAFYLLCHVQTLQDRRMAWDRILDHPGLRLLARVVDDTRVAFPPWTTPPTAPPAQTRDQEETNR